MSYTIQSRWQTVRKYGKCGSIEKVEKISREKFEEISENLKIIPSNLRGKRE